jgi:hypothetical protein
MQNIFGKWQNFKGYSQKFELLSIFDQISNPWLWLSQWPCSCMTAKTAAEDSCSPLLLLIPGDEQMLCSVVCSCVCQLNNGLSIAFRESEVDWHIFQLLFVGKLDLFWFAQPIDEKRLFCTTNGLSLGLMILQVKFAYAKDRTGGHSTFTSEVT